MLGAGAGGGFLDILELVFESVFYGGLVELCGDLFALCVL